MCSHTIFFITLAAAPLYLLLSPTTRPAAPSGTGVVFRHIKTVSVLVSAHQLFKIARYSGPNLLCAWSGALPAQFFGDIFQIVQAPIKVNDIPLASSQASISESPLRSGNWSVVDAH